MVILPLLQSLGNRGGELKSMTENDPILDVYDQTGRKPTPGPRSGSREILLSSSGPYYQIRAAEWLMEVREWRSRR